MRQSSSLRESHESTQQIVAILRKRLSNEFLTVDFKIVGGINQIVITWSSSDDRPESRLGLTIDEYAKAVALAYGYASRLTWVRRGLPEHLQHPKGMPNHPAGSPAHA